MENNLENLRHSCSHLLAAAVSKLWPEAEPTLGPPIEDGFYYDFDFGDTKISEEDFDKIEEKMHKIVSDWKGFERQEKSVEEAREFFKDNPYKLELIDEFSQKGEGITFYKSGEFIDLCRGGHVDSPASELKYFKLLSIAGAYWRGDEKRKMLTRIYGTVFFTQEELDNHLKMLEEVRGRDHRKIGTELDLFIFSPLIGTGLPLYTPKGAFIRRRLNEFVEELQSKDGYKQVWTPQIAKAEIFKVSGHYEKYKDSMFNVISHYSEEEFFLKPMNCPQHTQIYASRGRSYRDLPIRLTDFAMLYRDEKPGEINGLARVRAFSQDDCHVFCREDQVDAEIDKMLGMTKVIMNTFGFNYRYRLSTRDPEHPEKYLGDPKTWEKTEKWAKVIMKRNKIEHYDAPGEAAFYAPKMDLLATDALGREWQLSTVQIDYVMPERFGLVYTTQNGSKKTPVMLHRAIIGSAERFIMILLEHFSGSLPLWLSPVQVKVLPITERNLEYANKVAGQLSGKEIEVEIDERNETLQSKIRDAQMEKIPYMVIVGDSEQSSKKISVRSRAGKEVREVELTKFILDLTKEIKDKSLGQS